MTRKVVPFTRADDDAIRSGRASGLSATEIGEKLGRTRASVRGRIGWLHLPPLGAAAIERLKNAARTEANTKRSADAQEKREWNAWTPEQNATLRELWQQPITTAEIAAKVGRTVGAVFAHAHRVLGLEKRDARVLAAISARMRPVKIKQRKISAVSATSSHSWIVVGRIRTCSSCGARQFASDSLVGVAHVRVWLCDAPPCRRAA